MTRVSIKKIKHDLRGYASPAKAEVLKKFFKTDPGEYAAGDRFIGVVVPDIRLVVKRYFRDISLGQVTELLHSPIHEERFLSLVMLVERFKRADESERSQIFDLYLSNTAYINNWDLVDVTTPSIVGAYLLDKPRDRLYRLAGSDSLWERRISVLATFAFIRAGDYADAISLAEAHLDDKHDLMHKAVGWMLREVGKRDERLLREFLDKHSAAMPRTMLRYAIEKFDKVSQQEYLKKKYGQDHYRLRTGHRRRRQGPAR